jgi:hypothetical protein
MLRITVHEGPETQTILLEGKISGPWVAEMERTLTAVRQSMGSRKLQLDLRGMAFADDKGRQLLREIYQQTNARFLTNSPLTQYFADDAIQKS